VGAGSILVLGWSMCF